MFSMVLMLASGAALPAYNLPPKRERATTRCGHDCRSRYRLPASDTAGPSVKFRALAEDGGECNVVGAKLCTSTPRRILTSTY